MQKTPDFMPEFRANLPRNSHVLSHDLGFTATTGHLNPVFHTILSPGETIKLGFDYQLRTMPLAAAAFADLTCHTEYFFVPMQLLYQPFDSAFYGITDQFSNALNGTVRNDLPLEDLELDIAGLYSNRGQPAIYYSESTTPVESKGQSAIRLLDLLGYCPVGVACADSGGNNFYNPNVFPYPILAYNCIYQYYYRLDSREPFDQSKFNLDSWYSSSGANQMLSEDCFFMKYRPVANDYFTDVKVSPIVDVLNLNNKNNFVLAKSWLTRSAAASGDVLVSGSFGQATSNQNAASPTGVNFSDPSTQIQTHFGFRAVNVANSTYNPSYIPQNSQDINTANLRALFANEKLWSITGRAKKNYDDQTLAHFGYKVPHDVKHQITCFGHDIAKIHIGEVISTAGNSLTPLGEIAGKGYGQQVGQKHSFTAPCHGVVMAIFSVVITRNYEAGILKANAVVNRNDLYQPEYDHLGMQPLFGYETQYFELGDTGVSKQVGWQYRYEQWKRRYNRTTGVFKNTSGSLKDWIPTFAPYGGNVYQIGKSGKSDNLPNTSSYTAFLNWPTDVSQLFLVGYSNQWSSAFESVSTWAGVYDFDPFVLNSHINAVLVSTMSDYSLPRLDA